MKKRPLCMLCILSAAGIFALDLLGIPLIRGNPLPESLQKKIEASPQVEVTGEAVRIQSTDTGTSLILKSARMVENQSETDSLSSLKVYFRQPVSLKEGSLLRLSGTLERIPAPSNPGEFDSQIYYACDHIYYYLKNAAILRQSESYSVSNQFLANTKQRCKEIFSLCAGETAPVFDAIVLGDKTGLDEEVKLRFQMAGIIHILAISGLHIGMLGMGLFSLLRKSGLGIPLGGAVSLSLLLVYGRLTGSGVSTMRAVTMFALMMGAKWTGRIYDLPTALAVSAMLLLLESPSYLGSASFLLSFGAVIGVTWSGRILASAGKRWLKHTLSSRSRLFPLLSRILPPFLSSLGVHFTTLPVLLTFYGEVSHAGILLNLLVLPTVGLILCSAIAALAAGELAWLCAGEGAVRWISLLAVPGRLGLKLYESLGALAAHLPLGVWIGGKPRWWQIVIYYLCLMLALHALPSGEDEEEEESTEEGKRTERLRLLCAACLLAAGLWVCANHGVSGLEITCLDVGQGDGIVLRTQEGKTYLIDGGSSDKQKTGRYQLLPYLKSQGIRRLDGILVSHTDLDHISGVMEIMELRAKGLSSISVGTLYLPDWGRDPPEPWKKLETLAMDCGAGVRRVKAGDRLVSGKLTLKALAPGKDATGNDVNEEGMVLLASYDQFLALFTGDIGETTERRLLPELTDVDVLKVGHHGSKYSTCQEFVDRICPEGAVISCAAKNRYGHPSGQVVRRLEEAGCALGFTMKDGAVRFHTDGKNWDMKKWKSTEDTDR